MVYFSDNTAQIAVTKNVPAHCTAVKEEYQNATSFESYLMTCPFTTTEITFSHPNHDVGEGWSWLCQDVKASWMKIVEALNDIGQHVLAEKIRETWIPET